MNKNQNMRLMRILSILLCFCLTFSLASCNSEPKTECAQFKTEEGIYHFPGLPWDSTIEEVEAITGWNVQDNFVEQAPYYYQDGSKGWQSIYTVQDILFDGQQSIIELQFDPEGRLWCTSVYFPFKARDLPKQFKALEKELTKAFGKPDKAVYDSVTENSVTQSNLSWYVRDEDGKLVNTCGLGFSTNLNYGERERYLIFGAKWKAAGFRVVE